MHVQIQISRAGNRHHRCLISTALSVFGGVMFFTKFVSMKRSGSADLPLHYGYVPVWLAERMAKLGLGRGRNHCDGLWQG
jgi:hypothetical protein